MQLNSSAHRLPVCRSLKDLARAITIASPTLALPLPEDLFDVINAYLEKHAAHDDSDEKRLQDELLLIYQTSIVENSSRLAPFLAILRLLKPALRASGRLLQWWDKLSAPVMVNLGVEKGLASEVKSILLSILVYDEDEEDLARVTSRTNSNAMVDNLIATWLAKSKIASEEFDDHAKFVEGQIQLILLAFGKKRPKVRGRLDYTMHLS
jgi:solute carrier family 25 protein 16